MLAAVVVMVVTWFATSFLSGNLLMLVSRIVLAALLYFLLMKLAHAVILEECIQFVLRKKDVNHENINHHTRI